ncbi:hypothetical protein O181_087724 [Austropuccinia psidii MF-1]|uniref:Uncharacterized protein n=1 Tax=Austropuccinia psidii MF-1 TaxID=1389203 RepID=A0A9Q3IQ98_9BASI|nr:hypothetical protein [Austropuccinia psidii MF-1]
MVEKGWKPKLPVNNVKKELVKIHPTASRYKLLLDKVSNHSNKSMTNHYEYAIQKWNKSHKTPELKVGDLILFSTLDLNKIKYPKKLNNYFAGPFFIKELNGKNEVQVELTGEL